MKCKYGADCKRVHLCRDVWSRIGLGNNNSNNNNNNNNLCSTSSNGNIGVSPQRVSGVVCAPFASAAASTRCTVASSASAAKKEEAGVSATPTPAAASNNSENNANNKGNKSGSALSSAPPLSPLHRFDALSENARLGGPPLPLAAQLAQTPAVHATTLMGGNPANSHQHVFIEGDGPHGSAGIRCGLDMNPHNASAAAAAVVGAAKGGVEELSGTLLALLHSLYGGANEVHHNRRSGPPPAAAQPPPPPQQHLCTDDVAATAIAPSLYSSSVRSDARFASPAVVEGNEQRNRNATAAQQHDGGAKNGHDDRFCALAEIGNVRKDRIVSKRGGTTPAKVVVFNSESF